MFLYLLRLLNVIDTPFKVGQERTDDDVSLFLLTEFIVYATARPGGEPRGHPVGDRVQPQWRIHAQEQRG